MIFNFWIKDWVKETVPEPLGFICSIEKELSDDRESNCNGDVSMKQTPK